MLHFFSSSGLFVSFPPRISCFIKHNLLQKSSGFSKTLLQKERNLIPGQIDLHTKNLNHHYQSWKDCFIDIQPNSHIPPTLLLLLHHHLLLFFASVVVPPFFIFSSSSWIANLKHFLVLASPLCLQRCLFFLDHVIVF